MCSWIVLILWEGIEMKSVEDLDVFKLAHQLGAQDLLGDQDVSNMTGMIFEPCDPSCYNAGPGLTD